MTYRYKKFNNVTVIIALLKLGHSVHLLILLYVSIPHPPQSQSTLYNHRSTHLPVSLLFLPVCGWLMAVRLLQIVFSHHGKVAMVCYSILEELIASCLRVTECNSDGCIHVPLKSQNRLVLHGVETPRKRP